MGWARAPAMGRRTCGSAGRPVPVWLPQYTVENLLRNEKRMDGAVSRYEKAAVQDNSWAAAAKPGNEYTPFFADRLAQAQKPTVTAAGTRAIILPPLFRPAVWMPKRSRVSRVMPRPASPWIATPTPKRI